MIVGVDGFRFRRSPEESGHLGVTFLVRFGGKGEIFPVGLGFASEGFFQMIGSLAHVIAPHP
jgi:hypothetical protein